MSAGGEAIGRSDYILGARLDQLQRDLDAARSLVKSEGQAGADEAESAITRSTTKWGSITRKGLYALSGLASATFTAAAKGAVELENIQADYQRATGASIDESKRFAAAVNEMSRSNTQSLDEIALAGQKVRTDLGLTGDEAERTTQRFLTFARATKQDAASAVLAFDDILDAWGLEAKDSQRIMDALVASQQKYGGSVEDNQRVLAEMAPALRAANLQWEDGIGLLNMFAASGVDAAAAPAALQKALTKIKSPADLKRLIDDIASTPDSFQRAGKAAELFGARAGAKLANALAGKEIADFRDTVDDVPGATDRAREAIDDTFGTKFQLVMNDVMGRVRELGAAFGPAGSLVMAISSAAPLVTGPLKALGGVVGEAIGVPAGESVVKAIMSALSSAVVGSGMLTATGLLAAGVIVSIPVVFVLNYDVIKNTIADLAESAGAGDMSLLRPGGFDEWARNRTGKGRKDAEAEGASLADATADGFAARAPAAVDRASEAWRRAQAAAARRYGGKDWAFYLPTDAEVAQVMADQERAIATGALRLAAAVRTAGEGIAANASSWYSWGDDTMAAYQAGLIDRGVKLRSLLGVLLPGAWSQPVKSAMQVAMEGGPEAMKAYQDGLVEKDNELRDRIGVLLPGAWSEGIKKSTDVVVEEASQIPSKIAQAIEDNGLGVKNAMGALRSILENGMTPHQQRVLALSSKWGKTFRQGLESSIPGAQEAALKMGAEALAAMSSVEQTKKNSRWIARRIGQLFANGFTDEQVRAALAAEGLSEKAIDRLMGTRHRKRARDAGKKGGEAHNKGVRDTKDDAGKAGEEVSKEASSHMNPNKGVKDTAHDGGGSLAGSWISGLIAKIRGALTPGSTFLNLLGQVAAHFGGSLPEEGPLVGSWLGGGDLGEAWVDNLVRQLSGASTRVRGELAGVAGALSLTGIGAGMTYSLAATSRNTINHEHRGSVEVRLSAGTIAAARDQGATWADIGQMAAAARGSLQGYPGEADRRYEDIG